MSLKKGYCHKCKNREDRLRVFDVNPDAETCFCPHCMAEMSPQTAMKNYNRLIRNYIYDANFLLKHACETALAYQIYANVLEIESDNIDARFGRILSLVYMSTLRRDRFVESMELFDEDIDAFRRPANKNAYISFLLSINAALNEYHQNLGKRLTFHSVFYDSDCVALYCSRLNGIAKFKELLAHELKYCESDEQATLLTKQVTGINKVLDQSFLTADGYRHKISAVSSNGTTLLTKSTKKEKTKIERYRLATLDKNDKKLIVIKDKMFKDYHMVYATYKKTFLAAAISLILAIVCVVFMFFFWDNNLLLLIFLILGGIFALGAIISFILHFIWKKWLNKIFI